jgi:ankyrin repeat protein
VDSKDPSLVKFFHITCYQGNISYVQKLLRPRVDLLAAVGRSDLRDYDMGTALHAAAFGGQLATTKLLLEHGADFHTKGN